MMLNYLYGQDAVVAQFVADLIPHARRGFSPNAKAIGVLNGDGHLIAGLVYHNYDPESEIIEISAAALPRRYWMTPGTLKRMYEYPFRQCGCQMVIQRVPADDLRQLGMMAAFNFTLTPLARMFGRDRDGVIGSLTREAWESNRFNQRLKHIEPAIEEAA
jgi:RimJ/RimL family protein N-acetyltransferase